MPMLGIRNSEDEVDHLTRALLHVFNGGGCRRVRRSGTRSPCLGEDARSICESVSNWGPKLPKNLTQSFFKFLVYEHMLVDTEILRRKFGEV